MSLNFCLAGSSVAAAPPGCEIVAGILQSCPASRHPTGHIRGKTPWLAEVRIPTLTHASCFRVTYSRESGRSPMRTTERHGGRPNSLVTCAVCSAISDCHTREAVSPSNVVKDPAFFCTLSKHGVPIGSNPADTCKLLGRRTMSEDASQD